MTKEDGQSVRSKWTVQAAGQSRIWTFSETFLVELNVIF